MNLQAKQSNNPRSSQSATINNHLQRKIIGSAKRGDFASLLDPLVEDKEAWTVVLRRITSPRENPRDAAFGLGMPLDDYIRAEERACSAICQSPQLKSKTQAL